MQLKPRKPTTLPSLPHPELSQTPQHNTAHFLSMVSILGAPGTAQNPRYSPTHKGNPSLETVQHNLPDSCGSRGAAHHILPENLCDAGQFEMLLAEIQAYRICCRPPGNSNHAHPQHPKRLGANPIFSLETVQSYCRQPPPLPYRAGKCHRIKLRIIFIRN